MLGELALDVVLTDHRHQMFVHPRPDGIADGALFFVQEVVDVVEIDALELRCHAALGLDRVG